MAGYPAGYIEVRMPSILAKGEAFAPRITPKGLALIPAIVPHS